MLRDVRLPEELCRKAEDRYGARFASVDDLLMFVLNELVADSASDLDQREQALIEERLRQLGYV